MLKDLAETPENLPVLFRFVDGYYGQTSRFSVCPGDSFQANFVKRARVLNLKDHVGRKFTVPLTSTSKFGLILKEIKAMTIPNMLTMKELPPIVSAVQDITNKKGIVVVSEEDLIVIKERKHKVLHCYNLTSGLDVALKKSFSGTFTNEPEATRMYPLDIVNHLPENTFPCRANLYLEHRGTDAGKKSVTIQGHSIAVSLVATDLQTTEEESKLVHFPVEGKLEKLRVETLVIEDEQHLYEDVHELLKEFNPAAGITYTDMETDAAFDIQARFLRELRPDKRNDGMELLTNKAVYKRVSSEKKQNSSEPNIDNSKTLQKQPSMDSKSSAAEAITKDPSVELALTMEPKLPAAEAQYAVIPVSTKPPRPVAKPRTYYPHKPWPPSKTQVTVKPPEHLGSAAAVEADSDGVYSTIPDAVLNPKPHPIPRKTTSLSTREPHTSQETASPQQKPRPPLPPRPAPAYDGYTSLHPHPHCPSDSKYSVISDLKPNISQTVPAPLPHRQLLSDEQIREENIAYLKAMSKAQVSIFLCVCVCEFNVHSVQVIQLLDALHLGQYRKRFEDEVIAGDILADCDEAVLESELGINMKIHRLKLMKIIEGVTSAQRVIDRNA